MENRRPHFDSSRFKTGNTKLQLHILCYERQPMKHADGWYTPSHTKSKNNLLYFVTAYFPLIKYTESYTHTHMHHAHKEQTASAGLSILSSIVLFTTGFPVLLQRSTCHGGRWFLRYSEICSLFVDSQWTN